MKRRRVKRLETKGKNKEIKLSIIPKFLMIIKLKITFASEGNRKEIIITLSIILEKNDLDL